MKKLNRFLPWLGDSTVSLDQSSAVLVRIWKRLGTLYSQAGKKKSGWGLSVAGRELFEEELPLGYCLSHSTQNRPGSLARSLFFFFFWGGGSSKQVALLRHLNA